MQVKTSSPRTPRPALPTPWGEFRERDRDLKAISAHYFAQSAAAPDAGDLDQRTWDDLNMDDVFAVLDRTESAVGQQTLYARLRRPSSNNHLRAFEELVTLLGRDEQIREDVRAALLPLAGTTDYDLRFVRPLLSAAAVLRVLHTDATAPLTAPLVDTAGALDTLRRLVTWTRVFGERELERRRDDLLRVIAAVGEVDAALSVASYRSGTRGWVRPTFLPDGEPARMGGIRHPLLSDAVENTILCGPPHGVIITGSNMSGKSTFLRTIGVSAVLAQTINTCVADSYQCPRFVIRSCIGRADDPATGRSYYVTEVDAVLALVQAARGEVPHLMLFDELFRGTNAVERIAAGEAVLAALVSGDPPRHIVVAATHDHELVDFLAGLYEPFHFTDSLDTSGLMFDYKMRPGSAVSRNAIALLARRGAPVDLVESAMARAASLEQAREPSG
jgi:DNA mismatch repair ATPase MutS